MGEKNWELGKRVDENDPEEMFKAKMSTIIDRCRSADSGEMSSIIRLKESALNGEISMEEALEQAESLAGFKQDDPGRPEN